jgi:hypothetical protein
MGLIIEYTYVINLVENINVDTIFYKLGQT